VIASVSVTGLTAVGRTGIKVPAEDSSNLHAVVKRVMTVSAWLRTTDGTHGFE
jgi:hypothetical protein